MYTQEFVAEDGDVFYKQANVHNFDNCFAALIYLSFLTEFELFTLTYRLYPYNVQPNKLNRNHVPGIFCHAGAESCAFRVYRSIVDTSPRSIVDRFASRLDAIFEKFMSLFVSLYAEESGLPEKLVYEAMVPVDHEYHQAKTFDFIYATWKERLGHL